MQYKNKQQITFLLSYSSIFHLGAWRNSIELWLKKGYKVDLIQFRDEDVNKFASSLEGDYDLLQIRYPSILRSLMFLMKLFFRSFKKIGLNKLGNVGDGIDYLFKGFYFVIFSLIKLRNSDSDYYFAGDPPSLFCGYLISSMRKKKLIFWELELLIEKELNNFGEKLFKKIEKKCSKKIMFAVEFGTKRAELLRIENQIASSIPIFSIPNSSLLVPNKERKFYFNEKFSIPMEKKIILFAGGIFTDIKEMGTLWKSFETWSDDFVLVLHSRVKENLINRLIIPEKVKKTGRFFFHDEPVAFDMLNTIYASCDVGLILIRLNREINSNLYYSELSLGKLFHYLFHGVPIITRNLYGYQDLIDKNGVGFCFNNPNEISGLIKNIISNESYYKENCITLSREYEFSKFHRNLEEFIKLNNE